MFRDFTTSELKRYTRFLTPPKTKGQKIMLGYARKALAKRERLEYLRGELRAERISYGELAELQDLANYIQYDDIELLEAAGVPEKTAG